MIKPLPGQSTCREQLIALLVLLAGAFLLYANTFDNAWTLDDFPVLVNNPDIRSLKAFLLNARPGRPLRELSYLPDYLLFGPNPVGFHIQNIFWHGLNSGLLFALVRRLRGSATTAWVAALLFMAHPLQVEVVASIANRKDSIALAFCLLATLSYAEALFSSDKRGRWLVASFTLAFLAYTAKQTAAGLPLVFLALEHAYAPKEGRILLKHLKTLASISAATAAAGLSWYFLFGGRALFLTEARSVLLKLNHLGPATEETYFTTVLKAWTFMFRRYFLPLNLAPEYTFAVPTSWLDGNVVLAILALAAYGSLLYWSWRKNPGAFWALAWVGAFWLPACNLWPLNYFAADRYLYAPSVGLFILTAQCIDRGLQYSRLLQWGITVLLLCALATLTLRQNDVWDSEETLWNHALEVNPTSAVVLTNAGNLRMRNGNFEQAFLLYTRAIQLNPLFPTAHYDLGYLLEETGDLKQALPHYRRFLQLAGPSYQKQASDLQNYLQRQYNLRLEQ